MSLRPVGIGLILVALMSLGAGKARLSPSRTEAVRAARSSTPASAPHAQASCPPQTLPDDTFCVHWSQRDPGAGGDLDGRVTHRQTPAGANTIARRPDRPVDYDAYRYPVPCRGCVVSDDDAARGEERLGASVTVDRSGIELAAPPGTSVTLPVLEHQRGPARLIYVGDLIGKSIVTLHSVRETGDTRDYIVVLGRLASVFPVLDRSAAATPLEEEQLLGSVGDIGSSAPVRLRMEVRRVRRGVDVRALKPTALVDDANTIACDPRNVLSLK